MEDKDYYGKMIELFEKDILEQEFEQGHIGYFENIEYEYDETLQLMKDGEDMNSSTLQKGITKMKIELYLETIKRK